MVVTVVAFDGTIRILRTAMGVAFPTGGAGMFMLAACVAGMRLLKVIGPNHPGGDAEMEKQRKEDGDGQTQSENRYQQKQFSARPIFLIGP
jgi:hypothetical protein